MPKSAANCWQILFQSTPSVGRATSPLVVCVSLGSISIHALRGEGDNGGKTYTNAMTDFNPRPPWGGRPCYSRASFFIFVISIHALRGEGDPCFTASSSSSFGTFQSTPSVGRATEVVAKIIETYVISIHALRGEGDYCRLVPLLCHRHFNPRPPWGGRPNQIKPISALEAFQSTPSVGRATVLNFML